MTVTLTGGFGGSNDWLAFAPTTASDGSYLQYTYVGAGVTTRTWTVVVTGPGTFEFRLFSGGYNRLATSAPITAAAGTPPVLTVSATTAARGTPVTVTLTNGYGGATDWLALAVSGSPTTSYVQYTLRRRQRDDADVDGHDAKHAGHLRIPAVPEQRLHRRGDEPFRNQS